MGEGGGRGEMKEEGEGERRGGRDCEMSWIQIRRKLVEERMFD